MGFNEAVDKVMAPILGKIHGPQWNTAYVIVDFLLRNDDHAYADQLVADLLRATKETT